MIDNSDKIGNTLFLLVASIADSTMLSLLLGYKADPKQYNHEGKNALHIAVQTNNKELIAPLLEAGVALFRPDNSGESPWSYAQKNCPEIYQIMNDFLNKLMKKC